MPDAQGVWVIMLVFKLIRLAGCGSRSLFVPAECSEGDWLGHTLASGQNLFFLRSESKVTRGQDQLRVWVNLQVCARTHARVVCVFPVTGHRKSKTTKVR